MMRGFTPTTLVALGLVLSGCNGAKASSGTSSATGTTGGGTTGSTTNGGTTTAADPLALTVQGNELVNSDGQPVHLVDHLATLADLQRAGRFDRMSDEVPLLTGQAPLSVQEFVRRNAATFTASANEV